MQHLYPSYYRRFHCIAADCPDSCCQGWDVVIDSETEAYYHTVPGAFGDKLRDALCTDADGDRIFRLAEQKKCPFWGDDRLCDIYRELGEAHLCATCALFPRITMDYTVFTEHTLALACPEAARLILSADNAYADFSHEDVPDCEDYDAAVMRLLLRTRKEAAEILTADKPLADRLDELIAFSAHTQRELTGETDALCDIRLPDVFADLDYIETDSRDLFVGAACAAPDLSVHEKELTRLALYLLYRYYLSAIDSLDVRAPVRFIVICVRIIASLAQNSELTAAAQRYSKEIEQSYENMETLMYL